MAGPTARMTVTDIAELAGVERSTVSNWQRRYRDDSATPFPAPLADSPAGRPQFDPDAVRAWLAQRYPEAVQETDGGTELVRTWRYTVSQTDTDEAADPLAILIAAATGETVTYRDSGDPRFPVAISAAGPGVAIHATEAQAEAIRAFLDAETGVEDNTELLAAAIADYDNLNRWRRTKQADQAEENLYALIGQIVHEDSKSVLDFSCGTGALLAAVAQSHPKAAVLGMEPTRLGAFIAEARFARRPHSMIEHADILENDALAGRTFDAVVSIPPMGRRVDTGNDRLRRLPFGAVRGTADTAWPQLAAQAMAPDGEAFLVLLHNLVNNERADQVRRELIQQGLIAAVITLPPNAHFATKILSDLWVLSNRRPASADILFVDFSTADPSEDGVYAELGHVLGNWLDSPDPEVLPDDSRYAVVTPLKVLGATVNLDPLYWTARAATPTSAPALIAAVNDASLTLTRARQELVAEELPDWALSADRVDMMTVRDARDDMWLQIIRGNRTSYEIPDGAGLSYKPKPLMIKDAELIWHGEHVDTRDRDIAAIKVKAEELKAEYIPPTEHEIVRPGDVLVWATPDRQIRATVSTVGGLPAAAYPAVLRCDPDKLDPHYLALTLATGRNAIQVSGTATPTVRALDLAFPAIPPDQQRQFAHHAQAAQQMMVAARHIAEAAAALRQALADAAGSGSVGITENDRSTR